MRLPTRKQLAVRLNQLRNDLTMRRRKRAHRKACVHTGPARAAFIVGCQRSGTDMALWTLDRSLDVDRFDENNRTAFRGCRIKEREVRERLIARSLCEASDLQTGL